MRWARKLRNHRWSIVWPVETGLDAVAFAELCRSRRFRAADLTEPAWPLVPVPPVRTRRADFPQRAPQSAFARSIAVRQSGVQCELDTPARTMHDSASNSSTADAADSGDAGGESIEVGPHLGLDRTQGSCRVSVKAGRGTYIVALPGSHLQDQVGRHRRSGQIPHLLLLQCARRPVRCNHKAVYCRVASPKTWVSLTL